VKYEYEDESKKNCWDEMRLFAFGEAMRSYGLHMLKRWHEGDNGEEPLQLYAIVPWHGPVAFYSDIHNYVVTGCLATIGDQYNVARHELAHSVDDWINPYDSEKRWLNDLALSEDNSSLINLAYNAFLDNIFPGQAVWSLNVLFDEEKSVFKNRIRYVEQSNSKNRVFKLHNLKVEEWFAYLFQHPNRWSFATPELKSALKCYFDGGSVVQCFPQD